MIVDKCYADEIKTLQMNGKLIVKLNPLFPALYQDISSYINNIEDYRRRCQI